VGEDIRFVVYHVLNAACDSDSAWRCMQLAKLAHDAALALLCALTPATEDRVSVQALLGFNASTQLTGRHGAVCFQTLVA
jgi:hypothetical protein